MQPRAAIDEESTMRALSAFVLCGVLFTASAVFLQGPPSRAMQPAPTPPSAAARTFCSEEEESLGEAQGFFDPLESEVGVVSANDVEQPEETDESRQFQGNLRTNFLTLPTGTCLLGSLFYPAGLITVIDTDPNVPEAIKIFVEPGPGGPADAPAPAGTLWSTDGSVTNLAFPGPVTIADGQWARIEHLAIVGFRNDGDADVTILVSAIHPTADDASGPCGGGCRSRP